MDISPDVFILKLKNFLEETHKGFLDLLMSMKNMNDKDLIECFKDEFDDKEYENNIFLLIEENKQLKNKCKDDEDDEDELLSLKSIATSDGFNEVKNEY